jgi:hypothetical protein
MLSNEVWHKLLDAVGFEFASEAIAKIEREGRRDSLGRPLPMLGSPSVMMSAFAVELYLKSLLLMEGKSYNKHHELEKHFGALNQSHRDRITALWNASGVGLPPIDYILKESNKAFEDFRYMSEGSLPSTSYSAHGLIAAVRQVIGEDDEEARILLESIAKA